MDALRALAETARARGRRGRGARARGEPRRPHVRDARRRRVLQLLLEQEPAGRRGRHDRHGRRRARRAAAAAPLARHDDAHVGPPPRPRLRLRRRPRRGSTTGSTSCARRVGLVAARAACPSENAARATRRRAATARRSTARAGSTVPFDDAAQGASRRTTWPSSSCPKGVDRDRGPSGAGRARDPDERPLPADPLVHRVPRQRTRRPLPQTDALAGRILTLPLYGRLTDEQVDSVIEGLALDVVDRRLVGAERALQPVDRRRRPSSSSTSGSQPRRRFALRGVGDEPLDLAVGRAQPLLVEPTGTSRPSEPRARARRPRRSRSPLPVPRLITSPSTPLASGRSA